MYERFQALALRAPRYAGFAQRISEFPGVLQSTKTAGHVLPKHLVGDDVDSAIRVDRVDDVVEVEAVFELHGLGEVFRRSASLLAGRLLRASRRR